MSLSILMKRGFLGNKVQCSTHRLPLDCSICKLGKCKTLPFPTYGGRANICFEIIHSDVWNITPVISHAQYKHFVTFIDDYSRFTWIYFIRAKAEVFTVFQIFVAYIETQFSTCIKVLQSDNGGEYISHDFQAFFNRKVLYLNDHVLVPLNRMGWLNVETVNCWIWLERYSWSLQFRLNFGWKLCPLQFI